MTEFNQRSEKGNTSKLGALEPRDTPLDSVLAARTTSLLPTGTLLLRRTQRFISSGDGDKSERHFLRGVVANVSPNFPTVEGGNSKAFAITDAIVAPFVEA